MRLTPLDIRKQEFSRGFRGFDAEEVNAFLQMVANQWEELQDENRRREERIRELSNKLQHYEKVEEALQEALQTARESSRKALQNAEDRAEMLIEQAEVRAEEIKHEAERERHDLKRESAKLSGRRSEIVSRLRAFLMSEMEMLARYEGDDPVGFIKLLPSEETRLRQITERHETEEERADAPMPEEDGVKPPTVPQDADAYPTAPDRPAEVPEAREAPIRDAAGDAGEAPSFRSIDPDRGSDRLPSEHIASPQGGTADEPHDQHGWGDPTTSESDDAAHGSPEDLENDHQEPDPIMEGPGWTTRTVVSRPSEQNRDDGINEEEGDREATTRGSSEEIEKIRRILSDLD